MSGAPERTDAGVPWWVTLPSWRVGQYPAVLGELAASEHGEQIAFVQGVPPAEPSPLADLSASFARVGGNVNFVLTYGDSEGYGPLREAVAERMRRRGCAVDARDVMMLTGSTQGISLVAQSLAEPGDEIVVEAPTYPGALQIFQIHGLRAIPVPVDEGGVRVDHIEAILRTRRPRFIYTMPSLHNPTGVTLSEERRERLVMLARRWGVPLVEDDPYGELAQARLAPLIARGVDDVIYLSSFSKTIAPSLRLGWMVAPRTIYDRLLLRKQSYDMASSMYIQAGVDDFMRGAYDAHVRALRIELAERRAIANAAIAKYWPPSLRVDPNADGYYVWASAYARVAGARAAGECRAARRVVLVRRTVLRARRRRSPYPAGAHAGAARSDRRGHRAHRASRRGMTPGSLLDWYRVHGRAHLPWRQTRDPYRVVVSEFMLQQTQVDRVIPLYEAFIAAFPDFATLAAAQAGDVVRLWRGLGYNSRAIRLHALAREVVEQHGGMLPSDRRSIARAAGDRPVHGVGRARVRVRTGRRCARHEHPPHRAPHRLRPRISAARDRRATRRARESSARARYGARLELRHDGRRRDDLHRARAEVFDLSAAPRLRGGAGRRGPTRGAGARRKPAFAARGNPVRAHDTLPARPHRRPLARRPARRRPPRRRPHRVPRNGRPGRPPRRNPGHRRSPRTRRHDRTHRTISAPALGILRASAVMTRGTCRRALRWLADFAQAIACGFFLSR